MKWTRVGALGAAALGAVVAHDLTQKQHAILRNFPVVGHLRFQLERFGPELRQYIVTSNDEERPFSRDQRRWVYASSKLQNNYFGFGTDNDMETLVRVRRDQAPHVPRPRRAHRRARPRAEPAAVGQGAGRAARPATRVPSRVGRQRVRHELRRAVRQRHRGAQPRGRSSPAASRTPARAASRRTTATAATWSSRSGRPTSGAATSTAASTSAKLKELVESAPVRAIEIKLSPGRQAGPRRDAAGRQGERGDRRDPRHQAGRGLCVAQPAHRVLGRRLDARLRRAARRRDRAAGRHQVGGRRPASSGTDLVGADGRPAARRRLRERRRRRGRHRRGADDLRGRGVLPVPGRLRPRLPALRARPASPTT